MEKKVTKSIEINHNTFDVEIYLIEGIEEKVGVIRDDKGGADFIKISDLINIKKKDGSALTEQEILYNVLQVFGDIITKTED